MGPVVVAVVFGLLLIGVVALAVIDPKPTTRIFEVPISNDRFAR